MNAEIDNLKSQIGTLKDRIAAASKSTSARFKRKKIRSMKHEANKLNEKLREAETSLKSLKSRIPPISEGVKLHPPNKTKCIEVKIAELNKKIRRAKNRRNKESLIAKRN